MSQRRPARYYVFVLWGQAGDRDAGVRQVLGEPVHSHRDRGGQGNRALTAMEIGAGAPFGRRHGLGVPSVLTSRTVAGAGFLPTVEGKQHFSPIVARWLLTVGLADVIQAGGPTFDQAAELIEIGHSETRRWYSRPIWRPWYWLGASASSAARGNAALLGRRTAAEGGGVAV